MSHEMAYVDPEKIYADVNALDHVKEVCLKNERFSWVIQNTCGMLQFLEVLQTSTYGFCKFVETNLALYQYWVPHT